MTRDIIVPLDGSPQGDAAIPHAAELARMTGCNMHLVRVHIPVLAYLAAESPVAIPDPEWDTQARQAAGDWLVAKAADTLTRYGIPLTVEIRVGSPAEEIAEAARKRDALAVVCTTHGHGGWAPQWLGSVTDGIIRLSPCPVVAMSERAVHGVPRFGRVLVPLDGSATAARILPVVQELALASNAIVDLYRVIAPPFVGDAINALQSGRIDPFGVDPAADQAKHELERAAQELLWHGVRATSTVEVAVNVTRAILDRIALTDPDVIALTTHGRGLSRLFMGSVADKILRAGGRPTLCWRPPHDSVAPGSVEMFATAAAAPTA